MKKVFNRDKIQPWKRPWNIEQFDDLYNRDDRFFAVLIKGLMSWLNRNIIMYNKPINHFVFNTGSSYLYVEANGYEYKLNETTGEDYIYMQMPRCVIEISSINFPQEELTSPYSRGFYERRDGNNIRGFNSEIRRLPVEVSFSLKYVFSNFNESIVVLQEIIDKLIYQQYFNITYLGKIIKCSIEFPQDMKPELNKIDMASSEVNQRNLMFDVKVCTNYPIINERSEIPADVIIETFSGIIAGEYGGDIPEDIDNEDTNNIGDDTIYDESGDENNNENVHNNGENNEQTIDLNNPDNNSENQNSTLIKKINKIIKIVNSGGYQEDLDANKDNIIDYRDADILIRKLNDNNITFDYDKVTNKIYIYSSQSDDIIIDVEPYKFESINSNRKL